MRHTLLSAVVAVFALFSSSAALAADWTIARQTGEVWIGASGVQPVALRAGATLPDGAVITTGPTGRVLLVRGEQTISVGPNANVGIPRGDGAMTTILERAGVVEFSVDKRVVDHFSVETPYLAAVVKGTRFAVGAFETSSVVKVAEGRVQVTELRTGRMVDVLPGQQAVVTISGGLQISGTGPLGEITQGDPRPAGAGTSVSLGGILSTNTSLSGASASVGGLLSTNISPLDGVTASVGIAGGTVSTTVDAAGLSANVGSGVSAGVGSDSIAITIGGSTVSTEGLLSGLGN